MKISYPDSSNKLKDDLKFNNQFGKYLISNNFTWHGGVHIEKTNSPIKAIADGRIIAYRLKEEYNKRVNTLFINSQKDIDKYKDKKLKKALEYSGNFVLVQHDLELKKEVVKKEGANKQTTKTEKEVITFYSLYHHLMSLKELEKKDKLPNFLSSSNLVVKSTLKDFMRGIEVYPLVKKENKENLYLRDMENKLFLPIGTKFSFAEDINEEYSNELTVERPGRGGKIIKVPYKRITLNEGEIDGIDASKQYYIIKKERKIYKKDSNANTAVIIGDYDKVEPKKLGASVFERPDTQSKLIEILKSKSKVEIVEEEGLSKNWYKISEGKYVKKEQIADKKTLDKSKCRENEIIADDIPIKGGDLLGYVGCLNDESDTSYKATQVDVFMTDKVKYFLTNQFKAGTEEDKKYVLLPKGTEILKLIEFDGEKPKKGTKVKVLEVRDNFYAKIKIVPKPKPEPVTAIFSKKFLFSKKMTLLNRNSFKIADKSFFNEINKKFDNKLPNANAVLKWVIRCDKDGNDFKGNLNQRRKQDAEFIKAKKEVYVRLKYTPKAEKDPLVGKEFWIEYKHLEKYLDEEIITLNNTLYLSYHNSNTKVKEYVAKPEKREKEEEVELRYLRRKVPKPTQKVLTVEIPRDYLDYKGGYYVIKKGVDPSSGIRYARLVNNLFDDKLVNPNCIFVYYKGCIYKKNGKRYVKAKYEWEKHYKKEYPDNASKKTKEDKEKKKKQEKRKQQLKTFRIPKLRGVKPGEKVLLASNVTNAYLAIPDDAKDVFNQYTEKDVVVKFKNVEEKKSKKNAAKPYHYKKIVCEYILNNETVQKIGWVDASKFKTKDYFSAYNWDKFGFLSVENGKTEFAYELKAQGNYVEVRSEIVKNIWDKLDVDDNNEIDIQEIHSAFRTKETQDFISKLVWQHKSEWAYSYYEIKQAIGKRYNKRLNYLKNNPHIPKERKDVLEEILNIKLHELSEQVNNLMFWEKAKKVKYKLREKQEPIVGSKKSISLDFLGEHRNDIIANSSTSNASNNTNTAVTTQNTTTTPKPNTTETSPVVENKETEVKKPERTFPSSNEVYHFHPIAFVEHMKKIFGERKTGECYCNRDITVKEFKNIFTRIRRSEKLNNGILNHNNCAIPSSDKTFEKLTEEFNKTANKYGINQCIQKMHFIGQIYWESARFTTGLEFADGSGYNPGQHRDSAKMGNTVAGDGPKYKGRGFMQLTWRNSQIEYLKYASKNTDGALKGKTDAELELRSNNYEKYISDDLEYAMDSAGWFWSNYKKIAFDSKSKKTKYADILGKTLNEVALKGDKYTDIISIFVNGGGNGKSERRKYYSLLKNIFKYDFICVNNENRQDIESGDVAPWVKFVYQEFAEYQGLNETESPLKEKIKQYHNSSTAKGKDHEISWCASFVSWCFEQAGYKNINSGSNSFAFDWAPEGNQMAKDKSDSFRTPDPNLTGWAEGEECEPFVGAVIVLNYSHCAIIVGKNSSLNKYVYIGGNQGNGSVSGAQQIKYGTVTIGKEYAIMKPIKYNPNSFELPEMNQNADGSYASTR